VNNRFTAIEISQPCADHLTKFTILDKYIMQRLAACIMVNFLTHNN